VTDQALFESVMNNLVEETGIPRQILDKTNALVIAALKVLIEERDEAQRLARET
jgi:hypothetical protein